ncbi:hypothetical protein KRP69_01720 [Mammaliicoccus sciuri]|uniref:hypothetical protein n=1 Tax=Mammaliicoccus sciuri TaxID=1296 RepID=UPI001D0D1027|nr:hypothetical protein [Mammaliicoccus sciuri]MCC2087923.1 hypothetical protein [Mammaliicoccus sciuri]
MTKKRDVEVREWARQQNLDIDNVFNVKCADDQKIVKIGDKVHITNLKGNKVDILRNVTNVYSNYFTTDNEFSDLLEIKVHFTDQYKVVEYGSDMALYKALYKRAENEIEYLKKEIDFLQRQLNYSKEDKSNSIDPIRFLSRNKMSEDK